MCSYGVPYIENCKTGGVSIMSSNNKDNGKIPSDYISMLINGDQGVYCNATIQALRNSGAKRSIINAVKKAEGDLAISRILIDADRSDVLVKVFKQTDSYIVLEDYIIKKDYDIDVKLNQELADIDAEFCETLNSLGRVPDANHSIYKKFEEKRDKRYEKARNKSEEFHNIIYAKYNRACGRKY